MDQKELEEQSLLKSKHRNQNCGLKKIVLCGPKKHEARKAFQKAMKAFGSVDFALTHQKRVQAVILAHIVARARIKKEKARKVPIHNEDFQPLKTPLKMDKAIPGNQTIGIPALSKIPQLQPLRGTSQDILHGWHQFFWILPTIRRTLLWILAKIGVVLRHYNIILSLQQVFCVCQL